MNRWLMAAFAILAATAPVATPTAHAQDATVVLFVDPFPSPYIADWEIQAGIFSATVTNGPVEQELVVVLTVEEPGGAVILEAESSPEFFGADATRVFSSVSELGGAIDYDSSYGDEVLRSGRLPEGEFRICVQLQDTSGVAVAPGECATFTITFPDPPYLIAPFDEEIVRTESPIFQWTPLQVPLTYGLHFRLEIAEILTGQSPYAALTANLLHFEEDDLVLESYEYPIDAPPFEEGRRYAWWVQALDEDGLAATSNLGRSEIWTFEFASDDVELFPSGDPQSLELVTASEATGPLADFDTSTYAEVVDAINAQTAANAAIQIPLALDADFPPIQVGGVSIYVDRQKKSLAIRGQTKLRGRDFDIMFTSHWGSRNDPRTKALAIKGESFDGFFPANGPFDGLATSQAWFVVSCGNYTLESGDLPPEVRDFYGDVEVDAKLGLNLFSHIVVADSPWVARVADALNTPQVDLTLHGYIGPKIGAVFDTGGNATVALSAEAALVATLPTWYPERFDQVITEMKGQLEIGLALEHKKSTDEEEAGTTPKASAQVAIEATTTLPFLGAPTSSTDRMKFNGALKVEFSPADAEPDSTGAKKKKLGVEVSLELWANDILSLPAFKNVFSIHEPKITVSYDFAKDKRAIAFSAKCDVGRYKNAATIKIARASTKSSAAVDSTSTDGETPPPGGVPTPFKQAELLAKQKEREEAAQKKPAAREGKWSASVAFDPVMLAAIQPHELLADLFNFAGNLELLPDAPQLHTLSLSFLPDSPGSLVVAGSATVLEMPTWFLASRMKSVDGGSGVLFGMVPYGWSFKTAFPDADIPLVSELELSNVGLLFSTDEFTASSDDLYGEEYGFYRALYGRDDFDVMIKPGVNLVASLPVDGMDPDSPLIPLMDKLGVQKGPALLQGAIGTSIKDIYFRASLPPLSPPGAPAWFEYGQLDLELTGQPSIALVGSIAVNLDDDIVVFFVKTKAGREGLIVAGGIDAPGGWHEPFGIEWMTINRAALLLGLTPTGSVQLGFEGDLVVGEKDIRVAVLAALNVATGVPTNFMFDGASEEGVAVTDLLELQAAMAAANRGGDPEPIPSDQLPLLGLEDLKLKFAPKASPELNIERGLALGGTLNMRPAPDEPADLIAATDFDVGDDGIIARAAVGDFEIGPVSLTDAQLDLTLTREDQYFRLAGQADLLIMQAAIDVDMKLTEMTFDAEGRAFEMFMADVHAVGKANLSDPQFTVAGRLRNDFNDEAARQLLSNAHAVAQTRLDQALDARAAAISAHSRAIRARNAARANWINTPLLPRSRKVAARRRYSSAAYSAWIHGLNRARRAAAVVVWTGIEGGLRVGSGLESPIKVRSASFDGDLSRMKDGQVAKLQVVAEVKGREMTLTNAGFNFRDMGPGLVQMAEQIVQNVFRAGG